MRIDKLAYVDSMKLAAAQELGRCCQTLCHADDVATYIKYLELRVSELENEISSLKGKHNGY